MRSKNGVSEKQALMSDEAKMSAIPHGCGRCLPCRINKARIWTNRLLLESMCHDENCFLTVTYNDDNYPGELDKKEVQRYVKRIRRRIYPKGIRFFAVGEYGEDTKRAHYHFALFGVSEHDVKILSDAWQFGSVRVRKAYRGYDGERFRIIREGERFRGNIEVGELNKDSARYMTGYLMKPNKRDGKEMSWTLQSRKPGIGGKFIDKQIEMVKEKKLDINNDVWLLNGKMFVLGRYLAGRLKEGLNVPNDKWKDYYEELKEKFKDCGFWYDDIVNEDKGKRNRLVQRNKIYAQGRSV